ncbi:hypothetical protein BH18ACT15_BH18ACT15_05520 [soil metagenome]
MASLFQEPRLAQHLQVMRQEGLTEAHVLDEVADAQFLCSETPTDLEPSGFGKSLE